MPFGNTSVDKQCPFQLPPSRFTREKSQPKTFWFISIQIHNSIVRRFLYVESGTLLAQETGNYHVQHPYLTLFPGMSRRPCDTPRHRNVVLLFQIRTLNFKHRRLSIPMNRPGPDYTPRCHQNYRLQTEISYSSFNSILQLPKTDLDDQIMLVF